MVSKFSARWLVVVAIYLFTLTLIVLAWGFAARKRDCLMEAAAAIVALLLGILTFNWLSSISTNRYKSVPLWYIAALFISVVFLFTDALICYFDLHF